ncbi:hypothetical protein J437_LFUL012730, partial [Ladona fulva]
MGREKYSPDLAPSNSYLFLHLELFNSGQNFSDDDRVTKTCAQLWQELKSFQNGGKYVALKLKEPGLRGDTSWKLRATEKKGPERDNDGGKAQTPTKGLKMLINITKHWPQQRSEDVASKEPSDFQPTAWITSPCSLLAVDRETFISKSDCLFHDNASNHLQYNSFSVRMSHNIKVVKDDEVSKLSAVGWKSTVSTLLC